MIDDKDFVKEIVPKGHSKPITKSELLALLAIGENTMVKIYANDGNGSGFLCKVNLEEINLEYALFTNNHVLGFDDIRKGEKISLTYNNKLLYLSIDENRKVFTNEELDYTCIQVRKEDNFKDYFLIDANIFKNNIDYKNEDIFILQFPGDEMSFAQGKCSEIKGNRILYSTPTESGSSGSPIIIRKNTLKYYVIGLHFGGYKKKGINGGITMKSIIDDIKLKSGIINYNKFYPSNKYLDNIVYDSVNKNSINIKSNTSKLILFYLLFNINNQINIIEKFPEKIQKEIEKIYKMIIEQKFLKIGTTIYKNINQFIINLNDEKNIFEIISLAKNINNSEDINIIEISKNIKMNDLQKVFNDYININEEPSIYKKLIEKYEIFNELLDKEIEYALKNSVFEYEIIHITLVDKETNEYIREKDKCKNRVTKILFHGTTFETAIRILSSHFKQSILAKGIFFTDNLDYCWYYGKNNIDRRNRDILKIPKIGENFSFVCSEIYFNQNNMEKVEYISKREGEVIKDGIRHCHLNARLEPIKSTELSSDQLYFNEYLISNLYQILPLYGLIMKRVEFLVIWRDYNFNPKNPNNYDSFTFNKIQEFHKSIKKIIAKEYNSKVYYIGNEDVALKLINKKKYNKVIIMTNGNNDGEQFLLKARSILKTTALAVVSSLDYKSNIKWVKNHQNVILLDDKNFHEKFFKCLNTYDLDMLKRLEYEINQENSHLSPFYLKEFDDKLFDFPLFKSEGSFDELKF